MQIPNIVDFESELEAKAYLFAVQTLHPNINGFLIGEKGFATTYYFGEKKPKYDEIVKLMEDKIFSTEWIEEFLSQNDDILMQYRPNVITHRNERKKFMEEQENKEYERRKIVHDTMFEVVSIFPLSKFEHLLTPTTYKIIEPLYPTIGDLCKTEVSDLIRLPQMGRKKVSEIRRLLREIGLLHGRS